MASYGHKIQFIPFAGGIYRLFWTTDTTSGRIRYPRQHTRDTDEKGAQRFAKRWGIPMPEKKP